MSYLPYDLVERAAAQGYQHAAYRLRDMVQSMSFGLSNYGKIFTEAMKTTAKIRDVEKVGKQVSTLKQVADSAKKITDNLKAGAFKQVNPSLANSVSVGVTLFSTGLTVLAIKNQEEVQVIDLRKEIVTSTELTRNMGILVKQNARITRIEKRVQNYQTTVDKTYAEVASAIKNATLARQKANDALYETRANKSKLEARITEIKKQSNDTLYETRIGRAKIEAQVVEAKKQSNDALYEIRQGRTKLEDKIRLLQLEINKYSQGVTSNFLSSVNTKLATVQADVQVNKNRITNLEKAQPSFDQKVLQGVQNTVSKVQTDLGAAVSRLIELEKLPKQFEGIAVKIVNGKVEKISTDIKDIGIKVNTKIGKDELVREIDFNKGPIIRIIEPKIEDKVNEKVGVVAGGLSALANNVVPRIRELEEEGVQVSNPAIGTLLQRVGVLQEELNATKKDLIDTKAVLTQAQTTINDLNTKTKAQEKVNTAGIAKLDQILGTLPLIPARVDALISPKIPSAAQVEQAATTGVCNSTKPGGCMANNLGSLRSNLGNDINTLLNSANSVANGVQLSLLKTIDGKLGAQITGGISGKLVQGFKWLQLDRALAVLTFAATVQNHVMLSNNIVETLFGAFNNILKIIGLKDDEGNPFSLSSSIEALIKGIVGPANYTVISETWAKANRIYQATTNVLNAFQGLSSTILSGMELIAGNNSKIGNALRKAGIVLETAYGWMNPQPKFNRVTQTLQKFQAGASTIQMITQAPLDIINATTELQNANTELIKAFKEDNKPENKAPEIPEPDALKAKETQSKANSQPLIFNFSDLFDGED